MQKPQLQSPRSNCRITISRVQTHQYNNNNTNMTIKKQSQNWQSYQDASKQQFKDSNGNLHVQWIHERIDGAQQLERAENMTKLMSMRRSIRFFSKEKVSMDVIKECIATAGTAPSGAHLQPWTFVAVQDAETKSKIREAVEQAEKENYKSKMTNQWKQDIDSMVSHLHEDQIQKPYLTDAPIIIVLLEHKYDIDPQTGDKKATYYSSESCGIAAGILITAIQNANLMTLTSTPLGAGDTIKQILQRPQNERVYLLLPVGYPADNCTVPYRVGDELRKPLDQILKIV